MTTTTAERRAALVDRLTADGHLPDPAWRTAFAQVPRHPFVPYFFTPHRGRPGWRLVEGDDEWLDAVYSDDALVTQLDGDDALADRARGGDPVAGVPTSSTSSPVLMAAMLDALEVQPGHRVFEAATGTGYNAALLAHRLGDDHVTSVEVDLGIAARARTALHDLGYRPTIRAGDATIGAPEHGPFDRLIATVAVPTVPGAWLAQTRPGAVLVVGAQGRVLRQFGGFMPTRRSPEPAAPVIRPALLDQATVTDVPVEALGGEHPATFFLSVLAPPFRTLGFTPSDGSTGLQTWGRGLDDSTFVLTEVDGERHVAADGALWDELEHAYRLWSTYGRPDRTRLGLAVSPTADHTIWLDHPDHVLRRWG
ncbi:hypothetical protein [Pseudonocardia sp. HH130630-07]|uniref:hypothetical protein n=1 Tax=Pseudonocardia sp. HH130630-07 TaxID=1690815 RepID=UPI000814FA99|nr:hypothetical protein [Pseudonocardia sp. HH130630-07]ANY06406.1 hypothetical protein AFB00_08995 [Pseudonocardia sp. HH130630-07]